MVDVIEHNLEALDLDELLDTVDNEEVLFVIIHSHVTSVQPAVTQGSLGFFWIVQVSFHDLNCKLIKVIKNSISKVYLRSAYAELSSFIRAQRLS